MTDRECTECGTIAPETTMEFEQGGHWMRGTFRCWDTDACDRRQEAATEPWDGR